MSRPRSETFGLGATASLVASETRQIVLDRLETVERTTTHDLGQHLMAVEREVDRNDLGDVDGPRPTTVALHHHHLPRLDEHDIIEYDSSEHEVEIGPNFDDVTSIVGRLERADSQ
ncbi:hypothetical protein [Natrinema sp. 1APR25-10V2]|uniref:DUF7344 domain-containing protein n=1 Tax=Natrinema sp. 1APR25-10V2 TaxID=2951081 RepID=UPI0028754084|nr:hypothetical protein [Natrinema sp. 1APR25-10V2]MDS0474723.1 hypothetical protein [Natrinema sp. 1APR25-10V2]